MTTDWNSNSSSELLSLYTGPLYPDFATAKIAKKKEADFIKEHLKLGKNDVVMDIGSGAGYIAGYIASDVHTLHCVDISESFLAMTKENLEDHDNVQFHHISYGNLPYINDVDSVYCLAVMIHFNIYDVAIYLNEIHRVLKDKGQLLFDFYDANHLDATDYFFQKHMLRYKMNQSNIVTNINFNSNQAVLNICEDIGYDVSVIRDGKHPIFLATKRS